MIRRSLPMSVLLAAVVAACGGDLNDRAVIDTAGGAVAEAPASTVMATLTEWKIDVPLDTASPGKYTFQVENSGRYSHALEVEGKEKEWETDRLAPEQRAELTVELGPGVYELYCPVEDARGKHKDLGMRRTLVVRE